MITIGDGLEGMDRLTPGSVSLVLTDLPSGETRAPFDQKVDTAKFFAVCRRALKPNGTLIVMASSFRFAAELYDHGRDWFRYDLVWNKSIAVGFLNAGVAPIRDHEFILVFCRGAAPYNVQMIETGIPIRKNSTKGRSHGANYGKLTGVSGLSRAGATDRFMRSVLQNKSVGAKNPIRVHPQQKPDDLFRLLVRAYSGPGDLVVDPCCGSGTTDRSAEAEGRRSLCWDLRTFGKRSKEESDDALQGLQSE